MTTGDIQPQGIPVGADIDPSGRADVEGISIADYAGLHEIRSTTTAAIIKAAGLDEMPGGIVRELGEDDGVTDHPDDMVDDAPNRILTRNASTHPADSVRPPVQPRRLYDVDTIGSSMPDPESAQEANSPSRFRRSRTGKRAIADAKRTQRPLDTLGF